MIRTKRTPNVRLIKDINITPFTDVCLVLLIIFMVTAPVMMRQESNLRLNLPKASAMDTPMPASVNVHITHDERIFVNKEEVALDELQPRLQQLHAAMDTDKLVIKADEGIPYRLVITTIDSARQVGLDKIALATRQTGGGSGPQP